MAALLTNLCYCSGVKARRSGALHVLSPKRERRVSGLRTLAFYINPIGLLRTTVPNAQNPDNRRAAPNVSLTEKFIVSVAVTLLAGTESPTTYYRGALRSNCRIGLHPLFEYGAHIVIYRITIFWCMMSCALPRQKCFV